MTNNGRLRFVPGETVMLPANSRVIWQITGAYASCLEKPWCYQPTHGWYDRQRTPTLRGRRPAAPTAATYGKRDIDCTNVGPQLWMMCSIWIISCNNLLLTLIKYADDMALVGCLKDDFSLSQYFLQIDSLNCQFKSSFLELNIAKTKELVFGKGKAGNTPTPIYIDNHGVDIVSMSIIYTRKPHSACISWESYKALMSVSTF